MASTSVGLSVKTQRCEILSRMASDDSFADIPTCSNIKSTLGSVALRIADIATVTGPITFLVITVVLESLQVEYDRMQDTISALVWGQHGSLQTVVFYLFAFTLASLALRLYLFGSSRKDFRAGIFIIALMSVGFIIIAVFPTKAPGALLTMKALVHRHTARIIWLLFPLACLLIASGLQGNSYWSKIRVFTLLTGVLGTALFVLGVFVTISESSWIGALERVILANGIFWIEVVGIWFLLSNLRHPFIGEKAQS